MGFYKQLGPDYQENCLKKWLPLIEAEGQAKIENEQIALATAIVLQNTEEANLTEAYSGPAPMSQFGSFGANSLGQPGGGAFGGYPVDTGNPAQGPGSQPGYGNPAYTPGDAAGQDARMPTVVIPTVRRIFPNLLAHSVVGVQPMNGPVGFAFALRGQYGVNGKGTTDMNNKEIGYNEIDSAFTGASGNSSTIPADGQDFWEAFAGAGTPTPLGVNTYGEDGLAASLGESEWWNIGEDMPMTKLRMEKGTVTARSRKLGAAFSLEVAEDMMAMQGINVDDEMVSIISYEIQQEIDRQLLAEMVKAAIIGKNRSIWTPVSADGRHQLERISTLYTHLLEKSNEIAITTRRGPATFAIADPKTSALLERLQDFTLDRAASQVNTAGVGIAKVGLLRNGAMTLYRDTFAMGNYALLGYKGPSPYDSGIIYCPYIPVQLMRATAQENFSPRMGVRTRYGVMNHLFGAGNYYHLIKLEGLSNSLLNADGGRMFTYITNPPTP
jgi:hypothetical protein